jgi:hypothetical protein
VRTLAATAGERDQYRATIDLHAAWKAGGRRRPSAPEPLRPEQSDEERTRILAQNAESARRSRAALLADGRLNPTREGDQELLRWELARRQQEAATA